MTTVLLYVAAVAAVALLALAIYWLAVSFALAEEPRGEVHTIATGDDWKIRLVRFRPKQGDGEPVLLCHGAFGNHWNLCSPAGHSPADVLSEAGFDCWLIDLRGSRSSQAPLGKSRFDATFDDYVQHDLPGAIDYIRRITGFRRVHWVGHSMGGMLLYAYELVHGPKYIASGATLGSPPGFAGVDLMGKGLVARAAHGRTALRIYRTMPGLVEFGLRLFAPFVPIFRVGNPIAPTNWANMHPHVGSTAYFNMLELLPPKVGETLLEASRRNHWVVNDGTVDVAANLDRLVIPMLCIFAHSDPFVPRANASAFHAALPSTDKDFIMLSRENGAQADYNHVDLAFARNGRVEVFGPIARWIARHSSRDKLTITDAAGAYSPLNAAPGVNDGYAPPLAAAMDDASWRRALRRAADVLTDLDDEGGEAAPKSANSHSFQDALDTAASLARGLGSNAVKRKVPPRKTAVAAKKSPAIKPTARKTSVGKGAVAKPVNGAKPSFSKTKPASSKTKPATAKAKTTAKLAPKKPTAKMKAGPKPKK